MIKNIVTNQFARKGAFPLLGDIQKTIESLVMIKGELVEKGKDFLASLPDACKSRICPVCVKSCGPVALTKLVYTWEPCDCEKANFTHLSPTVWHKECFLNHNKSLHLTPSRPRSERKPSGRK